MLGALLFTSVALGTYALRSNSESLETIFKDRVVPLSQFGMLRDAYDAILVVVRTVDTPAADKVAAAEVVDREVARTKRVWTEYLATDTSGGLC
jgi:methyl-accepting chemotaxis protein